VIFNNLFEFQKNLHLWESYEPKRPVRFYIYTPLRVHGWELSNSHVLTCAFRATSVLGRLKKAFIKIEPKTFKQLDTGLVKPHLEFAVPVWSPYSKSDIETLEKVQRRAVKWIDFIKGKSYESKLHEIGIQSQTDRRRRGDMIQIYKWSNNIEKIQSVNLPDFKADTRTRGHSKRYRRELTKNCNARFHYLTNRARICCQLVFSLVKKIIGAN